MAEVIWSVAPLSDLEEIIGYIERHDPDAVVRVEQRLRDLGDSLWAFPERGRPGGGGTRELPSVKPYVLRYHLHEGAVTILSIRHGRRCPLP